MQIDEHVLMDVLLRYCDGLEHARPVKEIAVLSGINSRKLHTLRHWFVTEKRIPICSTCGGKKVKALLALKDGESPPMGWYLPAHYGEKQIYIEQLESRLREIAELLRCIKRLPPRGSVTQRELWPGRQACS